MLQEKADRVKQVRPVHTFQIPESIADGTTSIGMVELTAHEEIMAAKRAGSDAFRLAYELTKQSLAEVNGQPVSLADGSADTAFDKMGPKVRSLVIQGYTRLHAAGEDVAEGFLQSMQVRVG
jgi:hypothetical protein